jgi:hypothetical protein
MGFWEKLIGPSLTQDRDSRHLLSELRACYLEEARLAQQLREHADRAPHQAGVQGLHAAAEEQDRVVQLLHDKIVALGGEGENAPVVIKEGRNHWARVVQDLDDNQALGQRYNEQVAYWDPDVPDAVTLFRTLEREKHQLGARLRDIVVRADSHALD